VFGLAGDTWLCANHVFFEVPAIRLVNGTSRWSRSMPLRNIAFVEQLHDVIGVEVSGEYRLRLTFDDGTVGDVDFTGREWRGIFEPLRDPDYFARVAVDAEAGTVTWPNGADMAPEPLAQLALDADPNIAAT
jgi:hypothetical protein